MKNGQAVLIAASIILAGGAVALAIGQTATNTGGYAATDFGIAVLVFGFVMGLVAVVLMFLDGKKAGRDNKADAPMGRDA